VRRLVVYPGAHEYFAGFVLLDDSGHQACGVAATLRPDGVLLAQPEEYWVKGEASGDRQAVRHARLDHDVLLVLLNQETTPTAKMLHCRQMEH
jgi:hypothetical protein